MWIYKILDTSTSEQKYPLITEAEDLNVCHTHTHTLTGRGTSSHKPLLWFFNNYPLQ